MNFIISGLVAVFAMTLFSIIWGRLTNNAFSQPYLLTRILKSIKNERISSSTILLSGWLIHIVLGFAFLIIYELLWWVFNWDKGLLLSISFGIVSGLIGVLGWNLMFKSVEFNPDFNHLHYYVHLIFAHIVFSVFAVFVYINLEALS